uniref:HTH psq-type domain-containing protein n=1 Tax=Chlorocebus sabaeus TaxID=60711 RepID=A0A0D9RXZ8_CHLSB
CSSEMKSNMSLTLNQKLEMVKLSEEGIRKAEIRENLGLFCQLVKEKFLKEITSAIPANTGNSLIANMEKIRVVWIEDQTSHRIPLSQNLISSKTLTLKAERGEEAAEEKFEAGRFFMRLKGKSCLCNIKVQDEAASADGEAAASHPDLAVTIEEGGYSQQIFSVGETPFYWKMPSRTLIAREKLVPSFRATKNKLTLLSGANEAGDLLKPVLADHSRDPGALRSYAKSTLPVLYKAYMTAHLFIARFTEYFKPTVKFCSSEKDSLPLVENASGVAMPAYTSVLQPMGQRVTSTFTSFRLRNTFCKAIVAIDRDSSDGSGQSKFKTFWKGFIILELSINRSLWEEVKLSALAGVWKKVIPAIMDDFGFKPSVEEGTADVVIAREVELEEDLEDVTELPQSHDKMELLLVDGQRKWFLEMEPTPAEAVKIVEMTAKNLECYINLVNKTVAGFERIGFGFRSSTVGKMLSNNITCYREIFHKRKSQSMCIKVRPPAWSLSSRQHQGEATALVSQQSSASSKDPHPSPSVSLFSWAD